MLRYYDIISCIVQNGADKPRGETVRGVGRVRWVEGTGVVLVRTGWVSDGATALRLERAPETLGGTPGQRAALRAAIQRAGGRPRALLCHGLRDGCADARDHAAQPG